MSTRSFEDARSQHEALVSVLAEDPYVMHVIDHQERDVVLNHPVENWQREMAAHLMEKYNVSRNIGHAAISRSRANFKENNRAEAHVHQA